MATLRKFIPFAKVDAVKREVWGIVTAEVPDKDDEICDYFKSKPFYQQWSEEFHKATEGQSLGNLREMHNLSAVGKAIALEFRDEAKEIFMGFKVVDDHAWTKVEEGVYTGFSQGGTIVGEKQPDPLHKGCARYVACPSEISLVDNPCLEAAHFAYIKADGTTEIRKLRSGKAPTGDDPAKAGRKPGATVHTNDIGVSDKGPRVSTAAKAESNRGVSAMEIADLLKAAKSSLAAHFKKAAVHHEKMAGYHHALFKCHAEKAAFHAKCMETGEGPELQEVHKAAHAHHTQVADHHRELAEAHAAHAEHLHKMHEAHAGEDLSGKTTTDSKTAATISSSAPLAGPNTPGEPLTRADLTLAFTEVLKSDAFKEVVRTAVKNEAGGRVLPTEVKGVLVPRPGEAGGKETVNGLYDSGF